MARRPVPPPRPRPAVLVLTGASGAGKTTLLSALESAGLPGVACIECGTIYDSIAGEVREDGSRAQDAILAHWLMRVLDTSIEAEVAVLATCIRPHRALTLLSQFGIAASQVVVVESKPRQGDERLQAAPLGLESIDTSRASSIGPAAARLRTLVDSLRQRQSANSPAPRRHPPRLFIVCGLPGSGKTTLAKHIEQSRHAVRFSPDEWMTALGINLWDAVTRARIEKLQGELLQDLLALGRDVVIEWGSWARSERDALRNLARALGAAVELHFLDAPVDVLHQRISQRKRESPPIALDNLIGWAATIERPSKEELALFDPATDLPQP